MVLSWTGKGKLYRGRSAQNSTGTAHQSQFNPLLSVSLGFSYMLLEIASVMLSLSSRCIWKARWLSLSLVLLLLCSNASCRHYCALGDGHLLEPSEMD